MARSLVEAISFRRKDRARHDPDLSAQFSTLAGLAVQEDLSIEHYQRYLFTTTEQDLFTTTKHDLFTAGQGIFTTELDHFTTEQSTKQES